MDIIIVGAGGLGREIYSWLTHDLERRSDAGIKGFVDDNLGALKDFSYPVPVLSSIADYQPQDNEHLVVTFGDPATRRRVVEILRARGARFYTLIHPNVVIGTNVKIGIGSIICPNCILTNDITIGAFVFIDTSSTVGHDATVGDYTTVNGKVEITGGVEVGAGCFFGVGAKVIPGRRIGAGAIVGAGSIVTRHVPARVTVFGNPARRIDRPAKRD